MEPASSAKTLAGYRARRRSDETTLPRPRPRAPKPGDVIGGKYRLISELGRGGMGRVFAADHLLLDAKVALKFLHPHLAHDPISVTRFEREALAAATLKSDYAARVLDVDQLPTGELFIVMEYLDGASLDSVARDGGGLPIADAVKFALQASDALAEAHDLGIVHRDVKPANLFLTKGKFGQPVVKVLDFGLAKSHLPDGFVNGAVQALGTPRYMSPEQIGAAADLDGRSDVWSLGATLYELVTGRAAFAGDSTMAVFARILAGDFAPVLVHRGEAPLGLVAIIERCLTRDRTKRFASMRDLAQALAALSAAPACNKTLVSPSDPLLPVAMETASRVTWSPAPATAMMPRPTFPSVPQAACSSVAPVAWTQAPMPVLAERTGARASEPTRGQTLLAALAGPFLVAVAAGVMAVTLAIGPAHAASGHGAAVMQAAASSHLTAKAATSAPRAKALVEAKPETKTDAKPPLRGAGARRR